jgi:hypothetical protein
MFVGGEVGITTGAGVKFGGQLASTPLHWNDSALFTNIVAPSHAPSPGQATLQSPTPQFKEVDPLHESLPEHS